MSQCLLRWGDSHGDGRVTKCREWSGVDILVVWFKSSPLGRSLKRRIVALDLVSYSLRYVRVEVQLNTLDLFLL